jgi:three-Cys-motif partner protein
MFDGLPLRCVGEWANEKIHYLTRYFRIFATGMKNKWDGQLRYLEVCSGPGRCSTRDGWEQDGTALAILNNEAVRHIGEAVFIDHNRTAVNALNKRIATLGLSLKARAQVADYNDINSIKRVLREWPFDGLAFCLIDPTACDIPFEAVNAILSSAGSRCDLLISFFSNTDFRRNAVQAAREPSFSSVRERYVRFLGCPNFFDRPDVMSATELSNHEKLARLFREAYAEKLRRIGYRCADPVRVANYYHLLFASRHERGIQFWKEAAKVAPDGQMEFL